MSDAREGHRRPLRTLVRAIAMALAALSLCWGIALPASLAAAVAGAMLGVPLGDRLGRSRLRLVVVLASVLGLFALSFGLASLATRFPFVPAQLGTGLALQAGAALRFGATALALSALLRAVSTRRAAAAALELFALAAAIPAVFASHRDGIIARPLWISDYAWQRDIDPTHIFLGLGAASVALLALLLLLESRSGRALSSMAAIAAVTLLAVFLLPLLGLPTPEPPNDLGLTRPTDAGAADGSRGLDGGGMRPPPRFGDAGDPLEAGLRDGGQDDDSGEGGVPPPDGGSQRPQSEHLDDESSSHGGESPMAVVVLDDDYSPPAQAFYLRQEAWSQWNGTRLVRASRGDVDGDGQDLFPTAETRVFDPPPEAGRARVRALVALLVPHTHPFALESPLTFTPAQNPNPSRFVRAYRFESLAQSLPYKELFGKKAGNPAWSDEARAHYLALPDDPRYSELARSIVARMPENRRADPFAQAVAVKLHLDDHFIYSLKHKHAGAADPTADFLFGDRTGYCVHFSHAAVFLFRALGLPARVGTGYRSGEDDRHGSSTLLVRAADAHAWPEIYLEGAGWIVIDIAAKQTLDPPPPPPDPELQRLLGEMARRMPPSPTATEVDDREGRVALLRLFGLLLGEALIFTVLGLYLIKLWRRFIPAFSGPTRIPRTGYRAMLDLLAEVGLSRRTGESREAFARRVKAIAPSFEALSDMHLAAALGDPSLPREQRAELSRPAWHKAMRAVSAEIRGATKPWRRLLGALHPFSFLRSR